MNSLYINCQPWQLETVREHLRSGETVGTDSYCFRRNTYVITTNFPVSQQREADDRHSELRRVLYAAGINIPMQ